MNEPNEPNEPLKPEDVTRDTFPRIGKEKVPALAGLPAYLKDPVNYMKVKKALYETIATKHSHSDLLEYSACVGCQIKIRNHADMVRKLGFTSPAQYYAWRKVHEHIEKRDKLR